MNGIVDRLREGVAVERSLTGDGSHIDIPATEAMLSEAAAEIEALRAESSTHLLSIIADIREASGVGTKPMLSELAEAIRARTNQGVEK